MKKAAKVLLIYSTAFAVFLTVSPIIAMPTNQTLVIQLFFLPIALFLMTNFVGSLRKSEIDTVLPLAKTHILLFLVILGLLSGIGVISINKANKARAKAGQEWVPQPQPTPYISPATSLSPTLVDLPKIMIDSKGIGFVNVRSEPSTKSEILAKADDEDVFSVHDEIDGWYKVEVEEGVFGYISKNYTKKVEE